METGVAESEEIGNRLIDRLANWRYMILQSVEIDVSCNPSAICATTSKPDVCPNVLERIEMK